MFNLLCVSLYCYYSTRGNCVSQKSHVCGTKKGASPFRTGLAVEVVVQGSSYLNVPKQAWLAVIVSTKSVSKM